MRPTDTLPLPTQPWPEGPGDAPRPAASPSERRVLGRYVLVRRLGSGGFGAVWLARDETLQRLVAVKVVPRTPAGDDERAAREALAAARLSHPGVVALHEAGADEEAHYLVSELVEGGTLDELTAAGALSDRDVAVIGVALCDALGHAHERGVVHRDVKPQNVLIPEAPHSDAGVAKLTDFGVARLADAVPLTRTGDVVGTLAYMAPEQAEGRHAGPEADVYAVALLLYEAFAGTHPVRAPSPAATARRIGRQLPTLARPRPDLPAALVTAIDRALSADPDDRGAAADLRRALAAAAPALSDEPGVAVPARPLPRIPPAAGRAGAAAGAAVLAGAALAGLGGAPLSPLLGAAAAAALVAAAPRAGWLAAAAGLAAWLAATGRPGAAAVLVAAAAACPLLAWPAGRTWSAPGLAPVLGLAGLAGAFPALAGQPRRWWHRAALGALGFWWLALAEAALGRSLLLGPPAASAPAAVWTGSATDGARDAVAPVFSSGLVAGAALWAAFALVLPWAVRTRAWPVALAGAVAWAAGLAAATNGLGRALGPAIESPVPAGGAWGAALGAALALGGWALRTANRPADTP